MPVDVPDIAGQTALYHCTASPAPLIDLARILIVSGKADVNHRSRYGEVALLGVFQQNRVNVVDLLMEHGADLDVPDGDGLSARQFFVNCGPQITACIRKWVRKREGTEGEVSGESMACVCGKKKDLKVCARCKVSRYCSSACQSKCASSLSKLSLNATYQQRATGNATSGYASLSRRRTLSQSSRSTTQRSAICSPPRRSLATPSGYPRIP